MRLISHRRRSVRNACISLAPSFFPLRPTVPVIADRFNPVSPVRSFVRSLLRLPLLYFSTGYSLKSLSGRVSSVCNKIRASISLIKMSENRIL